jgi:hypothetical protein
LQPRGEAALLGGPTVIRMIASQMRLESVSIVPLLFPWVPISVVAVLLPKARPVMGKEFEPANPLGALPGIKLRHHQPQRAAVLCSERFAIVLERKKHVVFKLGHGGAHWSCSPRRRAPGRASLPVLAESGRELPGTERPPNGCRIGSSASRNGSRPSPRRPAACLHRPRR